MLAENILQVIGNTPIVRLNRVTAGLPAMVYAKLEFMNPGGSIKDRIGYWMIEEAERSGRLGPGGTIIEGTSGNTGVGLAIAAAIKGYRTIFVLPDKMSQEKIRALRAFGARVIVTPTAVAPDDPRSYYSVCRRLGREIPNSIYIDQYNNLANSDCHYRTTGPEILGQMPDIDVFIAGIGTGGTITGVGRYLREHRPQARVVAVDPVGSVVYDKYRDGRDVGAATYKIEGIGEDFIPGNYDFSVIDDMVQVEDKESFLMTRELLVREGIFAGISSGAAVIGAVKWLRAEGDAVAGKRILVVLPDSGNRYLSKVYDDDWMREAGFLEHKGLGTVGDLLRSQDGGQRNVIMARESDRVSSVIESMRANGISQVPLRDEGGWIKGVITEGAVLKALYEDRSRPTDAVEAVMDVIVDPKIDFLHISDTVEKASQLLTTGHYPLVVDNDGNVLSILTQIDILTYIGSRNAS